MAQPLPVGSVNIQYYSYEETRKIYKRTNKNKLGKVSVMLSGSSKKFGTGEKDCNLARKTLDKALLHKFPMATIQSILNAMPNPPTEAHLRRAIKYEPEVLELLIKAGAVPVSKTIAKAQEKGINLQAMYDSFKKQ